MVLRLTKGSLGYFDHLANFASQAISALCYQISEAQLPVVIEYQRRSAHSELMKQFFFICALAMLHLAAASPAHAAECYADYKAKQDQPLRLHYGVVELRGDCSTSAAKAEVEKRLARAGWTLLNVQSVFGPEGLQKRKANAGKFFLRF